MSFERILFVPLAERGNPAGLRRAAQLASGFGARLDVVGIVPEPSRLQRLLHRPGLLEETIEAERKHLAGKLRRWTRPSKIGPVDSHCRVDVGDPAVLTIRSVIDEGHDLVVVTTDDDRDDQSTIRRLLRKCPCPVWVIRPTRAQVVRVLVAVDPDPDEPGLNETLLELATMMAGLGSSDLHVIHAWELYGEATMRSSAFVHIPADEVDILVEEEQMRRERTLDDLLSHNLPSDLPRHVHLVKGSAASAITSAVDDHRINVLIMGTLARTGVNAMVMGNTAERVLDEVRCSVVAVKPPGFVSPLDTRPAEI